MKLMMIKKIGFNVVLFLIAGCSVSMQAMILPLGEEEWIHYPQGFGIYDDIVDMQLASCKAYQNHTTHKPLFDVDEWERENHHLYEQCVLDSIEQNIKHLQEQAQKHETG